jgi:hypothetical protein
MILRIFCGEYAAACKPSTPTDKEVLLKKTMDKKTIIQLEI